MPSSDRSIGLCKVLTGFTGSLSVTVGATTVPISPKEPTSAVELAFRVDQVLAALGAQPYGLRISETGVFTWSAVTSFTLAATGVIQTRLNVAASTTGQTVTGAGAHADGFYPGEGMLLRSPLLDTQRARALSDGSGATMVQPMPAQTEILVHDTLANIWSLEGTFSADQLWDYTSASQYQGRLRVNAVKRRRLGRTAEHAELRLDAQSIFDRGPY